MWVTRWGASREGPMREAEAWVCCAVLDEINFGLKPGDKLEVATTF